MGGLQAALKAPVKLSFKGRLLPGIATRALATSLFRVSHFKIAAKGVGKLDLPGSLAFHLQQGWTCNNYSNTLRS